MAWPRIWSGNKNRILGLLAVGRPTAWLAKPTPQQSIDRIKVLMVLEPVQTIPVSIAIPLRFSTKVAPVSRQTLEPIPILARQIDLPQAVEFTRRMARSEPPIIFNVWSEEKRKK